MEPRGAVSVATGNSRTAENSEATAPGHSLAPSTQPSVTPATSRATASTSTGAVEGGRSTRGRRGRPRGSGRGTHERRELGEEPPRTGGESLDMEAVRFPRQLPKEGLAVEKGRRGRRGWRASTRGRNATSRFHCRRPPRYELWGPVEQRLLGDAEWWGCPVDVNMQIMRGAW